MLGLARGDSSEDHAKYPLDPEWRCQMSIVGSRSMSLPQLATIVRWNSRLMSENVGPSGESTAALIDIVSDLTVSYDARVSALS